VGAVTGAGQGAPKPFITTEEAALALGVTRSAASHTLRRLERAELVQRVRHGLWVVNPPVEPLLLLEYLTALLPSYVSFQTALFLHGMISQIPEVIYVASLAQTRRIKTRVGTFSIHRLAPRFFGGFVIVPESGVRLATPEKGLLDTLYLVPARSRLFARLPEVELPDTFNRAEAERWIRRIPAGPRRVMVSQRLDLLLGGDGNRRKGRVASHTAPRRKPKRD
jgi:hypothetical protein